jgi:hypothetical protein
MHLKFTGSYIILLIIQSKLWLTALAIALYFNLRYFNLREYMQAVVMAGLL